MNSLLKQIEALGVVPVVVIDDPKDAVPLAQALCDGGLPCAEITFRTEAAQEAIRMISENFPQMLVGAGTVLTAEQVDRAQEAGASFIVSPGLNPRIIRHCRERNILIIPGCSTPTDVEQAIENDLDAVKFFPAQQAGGLDYIKAISAPYVGMKFLPTGGINPGNLKSYLEFSRVLACGGSWMVKKDLIHAGDFEKIRCLTQEAVRLVKESRGENL